MRTSRDASKDTIEALEITISHSLRSYVESELLSYDQQYNQLLQQLPLALVDIMNGVFVKRLQPISTSTSSNQMRKNLLAKQALPCAKEVAQQLVLDFMQRNILNVLHSRLQNSFRHIAERL